MKPITMFMFQSCPHCQRALALMEEIRKDHPEYETIPFTMIDEKLDPATADRYDYWYVPTFYVGDQKVHEGTVTKRQVETVFEKAME